MLTLRYVWIHRGLGIMTRLNDKMYGRLEATIANWTREVTDAHGVLTAQIQAARGQLDVLASILANGSEESETIQRARAEIQSLRATLRERELAAQHLLQRADGAAAENQALADQLGALGAREKELCDEIEVSRDSERKMHETLATRIDELNATGVALEEQKLQYKVAIEQASALEESLVVLQRDLELVQKALEESQSKVEGFEGKVVELDGQTSELETFDKQKEEVETALAAERESVSNLEEKLATSRDENTVLTSELSMADEDKETLESKLSEEHAHVADLRNTIEEHQGASAEIQQELQVQLENLQHEHDITRLELQATLQGNEALQTDLSSSRVSNGRLNEALNEICTIRADLDGKLSAAAAEINSLRTLSWEMASQKVVRDAEVVEFASELRITREALAQSHAHLSVLTEEKEQLDARHTRLTEDKEALETQHVKLSQEHQETTEDLEQTQIENKALQSSLEQKLQESERLRAQCKESTASLDELTTHLSEREAEVQTRAVEAECLARKVSDLEVALQTASALGAAEKERLTLELSRAREDIADLDTRILDAKAEARSATMLQRERESEASREKHKNQRLEEMMSCVREQMENEKLALQSELDAVVNQSHALAATLEASRAENASFGVLISEREEIITDNKRNIAQLEEKIGVVQREREMIHRREALTIAETESITAELEVLTSKHRATAVELARAQAEVEAQRAAISQYEHDMELEKQRTAQMLQQTVQSLQGQLVRIGETPRIGNTPKPPVNEGAAADVGPSDSGTLATSAKEESLRVGRPSGTVDPGFAAR